ncbi:radical SAM protein [Actinoplanes sp. DH11]|uniref:radical SAM protein n=1 Tax=Actinoplanes sp. DH11 TaxID=2857011 RepID=UPI001E2EC5CA|nr:radical SAM protein [Actinoplanes sp. DH11]
MFEAIVSPQEDQFVAVRPGQPAAMQLPAALYAMLADLADQNGVVPDWFADAAAQAWTVNLRHRPVRDALLVRPPSTLPVTYCRASWEINLGCNFSCEHCYLETRPFAGLDLPEKLHLIETLRDMGVLWFQITGGEPLIDPHFAPAYRAAHDAGMMLEVLTNGSRLARPEILDVFRASRPHKITVSMYGASPETAYALTWTKSAFKNTYAGLVAAADATVHCGSQPAPARSCRGFPGGPAEKPLVEVGRRPAHPGCPVVDCLEQVRAEQDRQPVGEVLVLLGEFDFGDGARPRLAAYLAIPGRSLSLVVRPRRQHRPPPTARAGVIAASQQTVPGRCARRREPAGRR